MNIFLDTSTLIKLYFFEEGTLSLETFLSDNDINFIFLSEIAKL
jgi:PIN domain nuclease of toxin-antitoxin system